VYTIKLHQDTASNYATIKWIVAKHTLFGHGKGMQIYANYGKPIGGKALHIMCSFHKNGKEQRLELMWAIQKWL